MVHALNNGVENGAVTNLVPAYSSVAVVNNSRPQSTGLVASLLAWDSLVFALICVLDMISTMYWVHAGTARESNPWLAYWMHRGMTQFVIAKLISFVPTLVVAAYYRATYPRFVPIALRSAIVVYLVVYGASLLLQVAG